MWFLAFLYLCPTVGHNIQYISRTIVILKNWTVISNKIFDNVFFCIFCSAYDQ
jgi:hypothetical protein